MRIDELGIPADQQDTATAPGAPGPAAPVNVAGTPAAKPGQPAPKPGEEMGQPDPNSPEAQKAKQAQKSNCKHK